MAHSTSDLAALEKEFGSSAQNHPSVERSFRLSVWVPTESVGKVIGSRGTVIQHIQRETDTRVVSLPAIGEKLWSPVVITGDPGNVMLAYCLITKITEEEDDVVAEFVCPLLALRSRSYGQHGAFVRKLSADHGVRVFVPDVREAGRDPRDRDALMSLEGPVAAVWRALGDIVSLFKSEEVRRRMEELSVGGRGGAPPSAAAAPDRPSWRRADDRAAAPPPAAATKVDLASIQPEEVEDERFEHSFSYSVHVPAAIVGLLLSVRSSPINFIATVGKATYTFISSPKRGAARDDDAGSDSGVVVFTVAGKNSHNVALAASFLLRVVSGERIKDVLQSIQSCKPQPTGSPSKAAAAEADGKPKAKTAEVTAERGGAKSKASSGSAGARRERERPAKAPPTTADGPEHDEEEVNAQLFAAPADPSVTGPSRRSGRRGGRGHRGAGRGGK